MGDGTGLGGGLPALGIVGVKGVLQGLVAGDRVLGEEMLNHVLEVP